MASIITGSNSCRVSFGTNDFLLGDDGRYVATVLASSHTLGQSVFVDKAVYRNNDMTQENVVLCYQVEVNGDVKVFSDEPLSALRITIAKDN